MSVWGNESGCGREAAEALRAAVQDVKVGAALGPVRIVPSNHVGVATRRFLDNSSPEGGRQRGIGTVTLLTAYRLAELLGAGRIACEQINSIEHSEEGNRPSAITWRLHHRLPSDLYSAFAAAVA